MDTATPDPSHALSGHNPTLFDVVVQYADMDMLRALVLTSPLLYEALQHCRFDHLTMVVLEAPILEEQQQVVYNGANPVPSDTFRLPLDNIVATSLVEKSSSAPPSQARRRDSAFPDGHAFDAHNHYNQNLIIPDYARNLMARARSVELVVYHRRLGTRISSFFTNNAHHLKYNQPTTLNECTSCAKSNGSANATAQYKPHLHSSTTLHCNTDGEHAHGNNTCVFSKHPSLEYLEGDVAELRRLRLRMTPNHFRPSPSRHYSYGGLPSLRLNFLRNTTTTDSERNNRTKRKRHTDNAFYRDGHFSIAADFSNTSFYRPRFQNLPLAEQQTPTTSLKIHIVDRVSFGAEDWTNTIPGCTIQPVQMWVIHDDASAPGHRDHPPVLRWPLQFAHTVRPKSNHIGRHFPRLASLVLQYTHLDVDNRCDIDMPDHIIFEQCSDLSHFFIGDDPIRLPHLQHFGVIGTLLDFQEYAKIALYNAHVSSLNINPGPQPIETYTPPVMHWIFNLCSALDRMEDSTTPSSYNSVATDGGRHEDAATNALNHNGEDIEHGITNRRPPPQPHDESIPQVETKEPKHKSRPRRKYNFSFDFTSSDLGSCCPHSVDTSTKRALANAFIGPHTDRYDHFTPTLVDHSQFGQHVMTCGTIYNALAVLYSTDNNGSENSFRSVLLNLPDWPYNLPTGVHYREVITAAAVFKLVQRVLTHLEMRCHYCSHVNPEATPFPGASPGDCTATELPPSAKALLGITNEAFTGMPRIQPDKDMYMRLRQLLDIPPHVVLRL